MSRKWCSEEILDKIRRCDTEQEAYALIVMELYTKSCEKVMKLQRCKVMWERLIKNYHTVKEDTHWKYIEMV